ncbi:hypothetical protein BH20ACT9_BH20ACT9_16070 [soil metagenome]
MAGGRWYWCLRHRRVEPRQGCPERDRLGPYESQEEAARWHERVEDRNETWAEQDERWEDAGQE